MIIEALRNYLQDSANLKTGAPVLIDYLGVTPTQYSIVPAPGARIVESYLDGGSLREFPFALQSVESTADDLARMENSGFYEAFADWLEAQTEAENLPGLGAGKRAIALTATNWAFLFEQGESGSGIYQIQCKLVYEQAAK